MKMCEQIFKKNIAGRIPETTRNENPFKRNPNTHQTKYSSNQILIKQNVPSLIYDYLETQS